MIQEVPYTVITDLDPALVQFRQQFAAGEIRLLRDAGTDPGRFVGEREGFFAAHRQCCRTAGFRLAPGPADRR
jgi:hypothetical protein